MRKLTETTDTTNDKVRRPMPTETRRGFHPFIFSIGSMYNAYLYVYIPNFLRAVHVGFVAGSPNPGKICGLGWSSDDDCRSALERELGLS